MPTKTDYIANLHQELGDASVTKTTLKAVMGAQRRVLEKSLKKDRVVLIPNVMKLTLRNVPPKPERKAKNPATGKDMTVPAKPASKKLRAKFLTDFKIGVGMSGSKSIQKSIERRAQAEPLRKQRVLRVRALSKLTKEERAALGLNIEDPKRVGRKPKARVIATPEGDPTPVNLPTPEPVSPKRERKVVRIQVVPEPPVPPLAEHILYVLGDDTLKFDAIWARLEAFGWAPQRKSSVSNILSARRDLFIVVSRGMYRACVRAGILKARLH